ncbi:MAG: DegV family protein [Oscillospiraceae bacterium]|nr:DegV family protein [Oscillospiraceae bacterium]
MITIVTDSTSYFKKSEAEELNIKVAPNNYSIDGQNFDESFVDKNGDFESLLISSGASGALSTAHVNLSEFLNCFEEEVKNGNRVLCITLSSRFSGAYNTANAAAKQVDDNNVFVFDSRLTAGGLYLLIKEAKSLIESGMDLNEIVEKELPKIRDRITIAFSVDDMTPLRNSGRLGFVRSSIGTFLNIKPILLCKDGALVADCTVRGDREVIKKLLFQLGKSPKKIVISYIGSNQLASDLYNIIKINHPAAELSLQRVGPVLGIHLGFKMISVSFIK